MEYKDLLKKNVRKLFLVVWVPWGEEKESDIDVSFGFVFEDTPDKLCVISIDKDELWSPHIVFESLPQTEYTWEDFYPRMKLWMEAEEDTELIFGFEYYDVTQCGLFEKIVNSEIISIEIITIEGIPEPFGIKILFKNDYIISIPISDGNTVETSQFNRNGYIEANKKLSKIEFQAITSIIP